MIDKPDGGNDSEDFDPDWDLSSDVEEADEDILDAIGALVSEPPEGQPIPITVSKESEWLLEVKALAQKHGPFSTAQIMKILPILMRPRLEFDR